MTMLLAPVRLELTTFAFLAPLSHQLSYRALFEEDAKKFSVERMEKTRNKRLYMGNREENISSIPKTSFTNLKDKSRTKLTSVSFFFLEKLCIGLVMILSC